MSTTEPYRRDTQSISKDLRAAASLSRQTQIASRPSQDGLEARAPRSVVHLSGEQIFLERLSSGRSAEKASRGVSAARRSLPATLSENDRFNRRSRSGHSRPCVCECPPRSFSI